MLDILDIGVGSEELDAVAAPDADAAAEGLCNGVWPTCLYETGAAGLCRSVC